MSQIFAEDGKVTPVTVVEAGPVIITQVRTKDKDGYSSVQVGYGKSKKPKKPQVGHLKGLNSLKYLREFKITNKDNTDKDKDQELKRGDNIDVSVFSIGDKVKVSGVSKGKGFQGVVKRHGFAGSPASHGHKGHIRSPGSIGQRFPQHTLKGRRMGGHMGVVRTSTRGLKIVDINKEKNLLAIKGAIPGRRGTILEIVKTL